MTYLYFFDNSAIRKILQIVTKGLANHCKIMVKNYLRLYKIVSWLRPMSRNTCWREILIGMPNEFLMQKVKEANFCHNFRDFFFFSEEFQFSSASSKKENSSYACSVVLITDV